MSPRCDTCGAEITTGLMAVFCPRQDCEFLPPEGLPPEFQAWRDKLYPPTEAERV